MDTDKKFCSILMDVLEKGGVSHIVCSPGSRNTPLLLAAASRSSFSKHVVTDERTAGFVGLGIASVTRRPVALLCTSGTAVLNYSPAVAEAYYQGVPLIVVSADRPEQWIDQDDSQTIRQNGVLSNFVKLSLEIPISSETDKEMIWYVNRIANEALITACEGKPGPVHINVRLGDPLGRKADTKGENKERIIHHLQGDSIGNREKLRELAGKISSSRVLIVAGFMSPDAGLHKSLKMFCSLPNVAAMTETVSNLRLGPLDSSIDSCLTAYEPEVLDTLQPDIVISIGGSLISRKLKEYLRRNRTRIEHWSLSCGHSLSDSFMSLSLQIEADPARFFASMFAFAKKMKIPASKATYSEEWHQLRLKAIEAKDDYTGNVGWSELKAFESIMAMVGRNTNLFLSNGSSVRYAQLFPYPSSHASYSNRGVSGIEGSASTAIGGSMVYKGETLLITGDLSMSYDLGALSIKGVPDWIKIIVLDNQGGGIFRFIPTTSGLEELEEYFCANPDLPLGKLSDAFGWDYLFADNSKDFHRVLSRFFSSKRKTILHLRFNGQESAEILKGYMNVKVPSKL